MEALQDWRTTVARKDDQPLPARLSFVDAFAAPRIAAVRWQIVIPGTRAPLRERCGVTSWSHIALRRMVC